MIGEGVPNTISKGVNPHWCSPVSASRPGSGRLGVDARSGRIHDGQACTGAVGLDLQSTAPAADAATQLPVQLRLARAPAPGDSVNGPSRPPFRSLERRRRSGPGHGIHSFRVLERIDSRRVCSAPTGLRICTGRPAYQNLRQRVDNFVANHLATHTWSPHLNKNQLRNNIRQQVLKSGMLESGIDRIISQVVDPKINHTFRPQVEKAVHEFLATLNHKEEAGGSAAPADEKPDSSIITQGVPAPGPSTNVANDAMSILETITSLNQEANAAWASTEMSNTKTSDRVSKKLSSQPSTDISTDKEKNSEDTADKEKAASDYGVEGLETTPKSEELSDLQCPAEEIKNHTKENNNLILLNKDAQQESSDQKNKSADKGEKKPDSNDKGERKKEKKEKTEKKSDYPKRSEETLKMKDEKQAKEKEVEGLKLPSEKNSNRAKTVEGTKEDCALVDSDVDGLTDITVSSVHTSDLSSFEEDTEEEVVVSDSMEEGEITSDDEDKGKQNKTKIQTSDSNEGKAKSVRHAYVHKPYLYSKYYSDSDDELTVEQRRQSVAKEKEERLLRRQINREKLEEKRKQKAEKTKSSKGKSQGKNNLDLEESTTKSLEPKAPRIKEVLKERKVLEKKVALSKKRRKDSRNIEENSKKKQQSEEDSKETLKTSEHYEKEKASSSKELKHTHAKSEPSKPARRLSESLHSADENKSESKVEREHKRRTSTPVVMEVAQEETEARDGKRQIERSEIGAEEPQKQKNTLKIEKHLKKDDSEMSHLKSLPKKEAKSSKEKPEKEKILSEEKLSIKHKYKGDSTHKTGDETEVYSSEKGLKVEENTQKQSQVTKPSSDDKAERKNKHRNERKLSVLGKDGKPVSEYIIKTDENVRKENNKKERHLSTEKMKAEHKSRRSSDPKVQKDALSSKQHGVTLQRRSESGSEDKCDTDSINLDGNLKPEELVHKERRRTKSLLEDKLTVKSKSKGQGKQLKVAETELQESVTKQAAPPKLEKEKSIEENDPEKQRKSKVEDKPVEETGVEPVLESATSSHSIQKDSSHRAKLPLVKEKYKGEKDSSSSRLERKLSDGQKSRSIKHNSKDMKKKEENKADEKDGKEIDSNHEKSRGNGSVIEKKLSRRLYENRRGSLSQETTKGEEKLISTLGTPNSSSLQKPRRSGDSTSVPEQEPMEIDYEAAVRNEVSKTQDNSNSSSQQDTDSENVTKQKTTATVLKDELKTSTIDSKTAAACKLGRGTGVSSNSEKHTDHKSTLAKKVHIQSAVSKPNSREKEHIQQGAHEMNVDSETNHRMLLSIPSENARLQKDVKSTSRPTDEHVAQDVTLDLSTNRNPSPILSSKSIVPQNEPQASDLIPGVDGRTVSEGGIGSTSLVDHSDLPNQSLTVKKSETTRMSDSKEDSEGSTVDASAKASLAGRSHTPEGHQATLLDNKEGEGKVTTPLAGESEAIIVINENISKDSLKDTVKKENELSTEPTVKQTFRTTDKNAETVKLEHNSSPGEINISAGAEGRNRSSEVDTSDESNAASSILQHRNETPEFDRAEKASVPTSTEGKDQGITSNPVKGGDATTTSSETGESGMALPCTSIEADEGFIVGACTRNKPVQVGAEASECTIFAAAEEGGGIVTEGFAESETFLTSTKEGESGECTVPESEDGATGPASAHTGEIKASVNSVVSEEKDDAVTSAGSEEKCDGSSSRDSEIVEGTVTFISEIESDGAVTSAGTEIRTGSMSSEDVDGTQGNRTRMGPKKETEGTVTCTGAEGRSDNFVICSVTGAGPREEHIATGAEVALVDNDVPPGTSADQEGGGSVIDGAEGESAVTSTGITEEDGEGPASCTGSEDSSEGCPISSETEESGESAMDSTVAKEVTNVPLVAASPCDDEDIVTSTGAKEEDDEGEGVVTSTGRGNEIGHASTCSGMIGEENEGVPICESAEGDSQVGPATEHVDTEAGAALMNANESNIDSVSAAEKEIKETEICSSAKAIVESSVTSAVVGKSEVAPVPEGCEGPMTSAASDQSGSQLIRKEKAEDTTISTGLVGGSYDVHVSGAVPECEVDHTSPSEKEDEGIITSAENEECDGLMATTVTLVSHQDSLAGSKSQGKGLMISTSTTNDYTPQVSMIIDAGEGRSSTLTNEESLEGTRVNVEEFEAPTPSAVSGDASQLPSRCEEKDECAMISTSIGEEFEVPISSAITIKCAESQQPVAVAEDRAKGPVLVSTEDFEVPMPSAPAEVESPLASTSKEEKDECALISTSIAEDCEASVSGVSENTQSVTDGSAVISTSSGEDCEGSVSSAVPQEVVCPLVTPAEETNDTAMISTSTSEGCEAVMVGAVPLDEDQATPARKEEDLSDAAIISTSTAECVLMVTSPHQCRENQLAASNPEGSDELSAARVSKCEIPTPSQIVDNNCQCPGLFTGDKNGDPMLTVSIEKGHDVLPVCEPSAGQGQASTGCAEEERRGKDFPDQNSCAAKRQNQSTLHLLNVEKAMSLSTVPREAKTAEAETAEGSGMAHCAAGRGLESSAPAPVPLRGPEQTTGCPAEDLCLSTHSLAVVSTGAKKADDVPPVRDTAAEYSSVPPDQLGPEDNLKTTATKCIMGQESKVAPSHTAVLPAACPVAVSAPTCEADLTTRSDHHGQQTDEASAEKTEQGHGMRTASLLRAEDLEVTVSAEQNLCDKGNEESPPKVLEGSELTANLKTETFVPSEEKKNCEILAVGESQCGGKPTGMADLQKNPSMVKESLNVENSDSQTNEEIRNQPCNREISGDRKVNTETTRAHAVEADPKEVEEEERHIPKTKGKRHYPSSEDELDDNPDVLDSRIEAGQRQCSETEPQDTKEENCGDLEELYKTNSETDNTVSRAAEDKDEFSSGETTGEKTEQNEDDSIKSQEEDQPIIIKRKRGRPRKYPVETAIKSKEDSKTEIGIVSVEQSPPSNKPKVTQADESNKETANLQERSSSIDDGEEKAIGSARRRGRKPKRSLTLSDDAESSEPERKRQKSVSESTEDKKDQESDEEEEEEEDDEPLGATTRSTTRSEAQRKHHSEPSARATSKLGNPETVSPRNRQKLAKEKLPTKEKVSKSPPLGRSKAQLSPSTKRKREVSPPGARTRGQQRVEEAPGKKTKR
ncbi:biorientation of chromosomes in cell division protein 1-like 1 [Fukomys damarensis]|uniref:biorientation of chromosomes in cell division protein 1-like 1 n=1 Tax=Fukomys damarensis TaxID=885580 RepID=UPI00053F760E|nr:biorientation of chromosomes in cell division protein 1-like 1 [Fukomys damarensis]